MLSSIDIRLITLEAIERNNRTLEEQLALLISTQPFPPAAKDSIISLIGQHFDQHFLRIREEQIKWAGQKMQINALASISTSAMTSLPK